MSQPRNNAGELQVTIKATLLKYADMSLAALTKLKRFMQRTPTLFDVQCFNNNPALKIAEAKNAAGHTVCYTTIESAFVISSLAHNPQATSVEMYSAGAAIEQVIAHEAAQAGATSLLMVIPDNMPSMQGEEFIRVVKRRIVPIVSTYGIGSSASQATSLSNN